MAREPSRPRSSQKSLAAINPRACPACGARYPADFRVCPRDATPLEDAPSDDDPIVGQLLDGNYEVVRLIGEGGMGKVYEARHTRLYTKRFAVKLLHHELAREPEVVTLFQRDAEAALQPELGSRKQGVRTLELGLTPAGDHRVNNARKDRA